MRVPLRLLLIASLLVGSTWAPGPAVAKGPGDDPPGGPASGAAAEDPAPPPEAAPPEGAPPDAELPEGVPPLPGLPPAVAPPATTAETRPPAAAPAPGAAPDAVDGPAPAAAEEDVVVLGNGSEWRGRIVFEDDTCVEVETVSEAGAVHRVTLPRARIATVRRARLQPGAPTPGVTDEGDAWFLLRADGRIVGWRNVRVARVVSARLTGWRLEEELLEFAQGRHLPATRTRRVEVVDDDFAPRLLDYRETTAGEDVGGARYERHVSGEVHDGVWHLFVSGTGEARQRTLEVPAGARGPLAWREHLRRTEPRKIGLVAVTVLDAASEGLAQAEIGFVSVGTAADEVHTVRDGRRLVSRFDPEGAVVSEEIAEGLVAVPSTHRRCLAAEAGGEGEEPPPEAAAVAADPGSIVHLAEVGLAFDRPDRTWVWTPRLVDASRTDARLLGLLEDARNLLEVRVEWHPAEGRPEGDRAQALRAWLLTRLREKAPDLAELPAGAPPAMPGALRLDVVATRRGQRVRAIALVVERPRGLVVLLCTGPESAWSEGRVALERFLSSLRLL